MSIEDELDMTREKLIDGDLEVDIPDDPEARNLDLIIDLALKSYKEQMSDIAFIGIKDRLKAYDTAERFLGQAKDAMAKKEKILLDKQRYSGSKPSAKKEETPEEEEPKAQGGKSRKELMASRVKKVQ